MTIYRDGQQDIGVTLGQLNVDNLAVTLEGVSVLSFLYGYDSVGANWDRLATSAAGLLVDTELPAAALLTDNFATPTAPAVGAFGMMYDGAAWDFVRGTAADGLTVNTELAAAVAAADNMANPTVPQVLAHLMGFDGATWDRVTITAAGLVVDTELPAAALLADNAATPTAPAVGSFGMVYDGATWDLMRGTAVDGVLVNLGANNDVDTELPAAALLADNAATPTAPAVGSFGMVYDGATWDLMRGTAVDGVLVNLGANNDVDTELPAAVLLADNAATPTAPAVGAFGMVYDGATWDLLRGNAAGGVFVQGPAVDGAAAAGGPVLIGVLEAATIRSLSSSQLGADARAAPISNLETADKPSLFNGTNWDRQRNNHDITALASGARVATTTSASLTNYNAKGMTIQLDVTAVGAPAGTVTLIEVLTLVGATEVVLYTFDIVDLGAVGTRHLLIYPGAASAGNWSLAPAQGVIPRTFRIRVTHLDANSITYSVVCSMIN